MGRLFNEKLYIEHEDFLKQLGTFSLAAAYNLSKTQIFSKNSFVNAQGLADEATYQSFWSQVGVSGCKEPSSPSHVRGLRPLWMDVQSALNETCRELFVKGFDSYMRVTEDDDKMHFEIKNDSDTQGLKITQHVRDNRKGFVAHTTCYTASGGGFNALSSWALHFGPVDQEDGAMLRGSCLGHLQAGSPLMIADGGGSV